MKITYTPNTKKMLEAILWIVTRNQGCDFHFILKTLFFADKYHLQRYGRPVTGDVYIKMTYGPVPSRAYDMLKGSDFLPAEVLEKCEKSFGVSYTGKIPAVEGKRPPDMNVFSGTDVSCLEDAFQLCVSTDFSSRTELTHTEKAWVEAQLNGEMDFALFVDEDIPDREALIDYIRETSVSLAL